MGDLDLRKEKIVNVGRCRVWKENTSVSSKYLAGIVTGTFLASETEPERLLSLSLGSPFKSSIRLVVCSRVSHPNKLPPCKPYVCIAEGEKPC